MNADSGGGTADMEAPAPLRPWIAVWALLVLPCHLAFTVFAGLSLPIDYFIYHDYAALQTSQHRLDQDLFAASVQGYLNPAAFAPLDAMLRADLPSWWIASILSAAHSLNALLVLMVCHALGRDRPASHRRVLMLGGLLGAISPMLLSVLGTSFIDPLTSIPLLAALWLLLRFRSRAGIIVAAGFLAGAGAGLKLSNIPFAFALAILVVVHSGITPKRMLVRGLFGATAMWAGFAAAHGWWSWLLWKYFGNPMFPLLNEVFRSPWAPMETFASSRFQPLSMLDVLTLPFRVAIPQSWIYTETTSPDLTPTLIVLLAAAAGLRLAWRSAAVRAQRPLRVEVHFWTFLVASWCLWQFSSGNGRYAIPLFVLTGVGVALLALRVLRVERATMLCGLLLLLQAGNTWFAGVVRWTEGQWTRHWTVMDVPDVLRDTPMLYLSADGIGKSALARHVHAESAFVQLVGAYSVPSTGVTGEWLQRRIRQYRGRTRVLFSTPSQAPLSSSDAKAYVDMLNRTIDRIGLTVVSTDCEQIRVNNQVGEGPNLNRSLALSPEQTIWACAAQPATPSATLAANRQAAEGLLATLESHCPELYRPRGLQIEGDGRSWTRVYPSHDVLIVTVNMVDRTVVRRLYGQSSNDPVGKFGFWAADLAEHNCSLPYDGARGAASLKHANLRSPP